MVGAGVVVGTGYLDDNSFLTHLATGRLILDRGSVPSADVFTFSASGATWVVQSWLASIAFAVAERLDGPAGIILLRAGLSGALAGLAWALTRPAGALLPRLTITTLVVIAGTTAWAERPLLFGLLGLATTLLIADRRADPRWLVPVMWVWANCHGSFPLGLVALAALALGRRLDGESAAVELRALLWAAVGTLSACVGPLGPRVLLFPVELLSRQSVLSDVLEWQAPRFTTAAERAFLLQVLLSVVVIARRPTWRSVVPFAVFLGAALVASRNIGPAGLVFAAATSPAAVGLGSLTGDEHRTWVLPATGLVRALIIIVGLGRADAGFNGAPYPVAAASWVESHRFAEDGMRIVSQDYVGNYLEARFGPRRLVFVDDRYDTLPVDVLDDYRVLLAGRPGWESTLDGLRADAVLWRIDEPLGQLLAASARWRIEYTDEGWVVATPR